MHIEPPVRMGNAPGVTRLSRRAREASATPRPFRGTLERLGVLRRALEHEHDLLLGLHELPRAFERLREAEAEALIDAQSVAGYERVPDDEALAAGALAAARRSIADEPWPRPGPSDESRW